MMTVSSSTVQSILLRIAATSGKIKAFLNIVEYFIKHAKLMPSFG